MHFTNELKWEVEYVLGKKKQATPLGPAVAKERFSPKDTVGLTSSQVQIRIDEGLDNGGTFLKSKSEKQIILENTFTFFNTINFILAILVILVGSYKNVLFMGVIFSNAIIGSFQGIRSKRIIDKLSLISAPKAVVMRDSAKQTIAVGQVVLDDILCLGAGNQVCADAIVAGGEVEVNESLITGESDPVIKKAGDTLLSGSFIVSGDCRARVEQVGEQSYANRIAKDAKYVKKHNSQIMRSLDMIVRIIGFSIIPVGLALFAKSYYLVGDTLATAVVSTVAAVIGMIPEGLVLLTSVVFAVSVIRLSSHKTLVQELYCIETLARVDVLCLDKTGTITEGSMQVEDYVPMGIHTVAEMREALGALTTCLTDDNPTFNALKDDLGATSTWEMQDHVPFSSARKWSGATFAQKGTYVMGAGEFILQDGFGAISEQVAGFAKTGCRVLLLVCAKEGFCEKALPKDLELLGLVLISDKIREEAPRTLQYFADQGVTLKIISGDNAMTVANIARKAGLEAADNFVDATTLETPEQIADAVQRYAVFGRVTPQQKLAFVKALKSQGHTVAMTGDGVNDVLALKEADCSIAMASGSDAARTVSNLVLLDSNFASMPKVVQEGRRSINNLQRSATLFLGKTIYSVLMSIYFLFVSASYPFEPIQLTLISTLSIGIPSFLLALEPNKDRVQGNFLINVINSAIPTGLTIFASIVILTVFGSSFGLSGPQMSTLAVIVTTVAGLILMVRICFPFTLMRTALVSLMAIAFVISAVYFQSLFSMVSLTFPMVLILIPLMLLTAFLMMTLTHMTQNVFSLNEEMFKHKNRKP